MSLDANFLRYKDEISNDNSRLIHRVGQTPFSTYVLAGIMRECPRNYDRLIRGDIDAHGVTDI